ncbi:class A beta-lactamase [Qipengyuania sp. XHP0207]|uniref:class A beta-lactamase n=1 Tax=Qipengyuania sp. XHP0207 TaxID=3038078 RepID=UPI00241D1A18|nr:class A beta-lactamase [Qipengyuania sp. XHP0207]MDG5748676.1 class A beta-lactamase [Qipengyuania sp. XHP0207]
MADAIEPDRVLYDSIGAIEARSGARIGIALYSQEHGVITSYRGAERFALCSTFKFALAAMALRQPGLRDAQLHFEPADILSYAPYAKERASIGWMSGLEAAHHAVTLSDNTAANLLLAEIGGPARFTAWLREIGDDATRLDRIEPALNENAAGDPRDTTTPRAMARTVSELVWGDAMPVDDRNLLRDWLIETPTGSRRLRAGLPARWDAGDKTGTCGSENRRAINDIAVFSTPDGQRYVLAAYLNQSSGSIADGEAVLAEVAATIAKALPATGT